MPFYLLYRKTATVDGRRKTFTVKTLEHIIKLSEVFDGELTDRDIVSLSGSTHDTVSPVLIGVQLKPIWVDGIDNYFVLKPPRYLSEIREHAKGSKFPYGFIERLLIETAKRHRKDKGLVMVSKPLTLASELRMDGWIRKRQWKRIQDTLDWCGEIAQELGYVERISTRTRGGELRYEIILNPRKVTGD